MLLMLLAMGGVRACPRGDADLVPVGPLLGKPNNGGKQPVVLAHSRLCVHGRGVS